MGERTITVACRDCGTTFDHTTRSNKPKLLCDPCLQEMQRQATREHKRRKRAAARASRAPRACLGCGTDISGLHGKILRCGECRMELARQYQRDLRAANPKPHRVFFCVACNAEIDRKSRSGTAKYCAECKAAALRRTRRRADTKRRPVTRSTLYTHCHYCKGELPKPRWSARSPARCEACKRAWHYEYMRNRTTKRDAAARCRDCGKRVNPKRKGPRMRCADCQLVRRRARYRQYAHERRASINGVGSEDFLSIEIYERDGWRCGLCRRKIRQELTYPHPLSASLDHVIPLVHGGAHSRSNCQAAHLRCNVIKKDKIENVQMALFG